MDERIFEDAGIVLRVAEGERVELKNEARGRPGFGRAHLLPIPAQKIGKGARFFGVFEPGADAGVSESTYAEKDLAHQSFARSKVIDKHAGIRLQGFGEGPQGQVADAVREHIINSLIAKAGADVGFGRSSHRNFSLFLITVTYVTLIAREFSRGVQVCEKV